MKFSLLGNMRVGDSCSLAAVCDDCMATVVSEPGTTVANIQSEMHTHRLALEAAHKSDSMTSEVGESDKACELSYRALYKFIEVLTIGNTAHQAKAITLFNVLEKYGTTIVRNSIGEQVASMVGLATDLQATDMQTIINDMPILPELYNDWLTSLDNLRTVETNYRQFKASHRDDDTATDAKRNFVNFLMTDFTDFFNYSVRFNPDVYKPLENEIQEKVDEIISLIKRRKTMAAKRAAKLEENSSSDANNQNEETPNDGDNSSN